MNTKHIIGALLVLIVGFGVGVYLYDSNDVTTSVTTQAPADSTSTIVTTGNTSADSPKAAVITTVGTEKTTNAVVAQPAVPVETDTVEAE